MSRSCQRAMSSRPTWAFARSTRARPQMRSHTIGLRLCGIAEEPFCPAANGSSASRTSVRCRWRTSSGEPLERRADAGDRREQRRVAVAGHHLGGDVLAVEAERVQRRGLHARVGVRVRAHRARELADAHAVEGAACSRTRWRRSSVTQPSTFRPKVVGSAWTPWVRPTIGVCRNSSARTTAAASTASTPASSSSPASRSCSARPVSTTSEDVRP